MIHKTESHITRSEFLSIIESIKEGGIYFISETTLSSKKRLLITLCFYKGKYILRSGIYERGLKKYVLILSDESEINDRLKNITLSLKNKGDTYEYLLSVL